MGLLLSRRAGQTILIGDDIRITVERIHMQKATLLVTAPDDVRVDREEVRGRILAEDDTEFDAAGNLP